MELIQTTNTDGNTIRSCRFATVQTGTLSLLNKMFEKENPERLVDAPQRIILSAHKSGQILTAEQVGVVHSAQPIFFLVLWKSEMILYSLWGYRKF